jgi:hypothetical protein
VVGAVGKRIAVHRQQRTACAGHIFLPSFRSLGRLE